MKQKIITPLLGLALLFCTTGCIASAPKKPMATNAHSSATQTPSSSQYLELENRPYQTQQPVLQAIHYQHNDTNTAGHNFTPITAEDSEALNALIQQVSNPQQPVVKSVVKPDAFKGGYVSTQPQNAALLRKVNLRIDPNKERLLARSGYITMASCQGKNPIPAILPYSVAILTPNAQHPIGFNYAHRTDPASTFKLISLAMLGNHMEKNNIPLEAPLPRSAVQKIPSYDSWWLKQLPNPTYRDLVALVYGRSDNSATEFLVREIVHPNTSLIGATDRINLFVQSLDVALNNTCILNPSGYPNGVDREPNPFQLAPRTFQTTPLEAALINRQIRGFLSPIMPALTTNAVRLSNGTMLSYRNADFTGPGLVGKTGTTKPARNVAGTLDTNFGVISYAIMGRNARARAPEVLEAMQQALAQTQHLSSSEAELQFSKIMQGSLSQ